ncbi:helix-turn-helix transcriptional regulator [Nonomuraea sp. MG754425]|uniref:TetR/AcrR family transcriptional regulator n=1 Tax=Nonomuraea sp. MG754425 TaxID=2570319 RepID=UPI001F2981B3|nr:TetR/AcrR family transcriptional regulator [Nonomuraea sp. MG754425]MCF6475884.1 helix-turn-helix transcriptional regulator [Nonomuraea sp. MG754425]
MVVRPSVDTNVILDAAARLIAEQGFGGVRMDAVAARAGVAKGVLYLRFTDKDELLRAVVDRELVLATRHSIELVLADPGGGSFSRLYVHAVTALHGRPALLRLYQEPAPLRGLAHDDGRVRARELLGAEFIRVLQAAGIVTADLDAGVLAANLTLWNQALARRAAPTETDALILGMGELMARAADTGIADTTAGKRAYVTFAEALIAEREQ